MMRQDWVEVELGHVCEKVAKVKRKEMPLEQPLIYIDIGGIDNASNKIVDHKEYTWSDAPSRAQQVVRVGDVLFSTVRTYLKNIAQVTIPKYNNEICSSGFTVIRGQEGILHPRYVFYLTLFEGFLQPLNELQTGTSYPAVRDRDVFAQRILLAPVPEQRAIISKIEQLFSELDNGIANLKAAKDKLGIYRQAVLKMAFEGDLTKTWRSKHSNLSAAADLCKTVKNGREKEFTRRIKEWRAKSEEAKPTDKKPAKPKKPVYGKALTVEETKGMPSTPHSWHVVRFIDLVKYEDNAIKRGPFGSSIKKAFFVQSGYKVYEQQNAIQDDSTLGTYRIDNEKFEELQRFSVSGGDYIVSCSGTIGKIHRLEPDCETGVINQALLKIVLDEQLMDPEYFLYMFRSEVFQRKILRGTRGTGMQNLASVGEIKNIPIQLPPREEQEQIVSEIDARLSVCDSIINNIAEGLEKAEALRQSILKKAFRGSLLSKEELNACRKEPDWEPADKLLERIKKQRNEQV